MEKKNPTLLIGLGGTGVGAVSLIKAMIEKNDPPRCVISLGLDTDGPEKEPADITLSEHTSNRQEEAL